MSEVHVPVTESYGAVGHRAGYSDQPPTYAEINDPNAPPPTYESLYGELRTVSTVDAFVGFVVKAAGVIAGTLLATVLLAVFNVIPIAMIVIGWVHWDDCPANPRVPIWLLVAGALSLVKSFVNFAYRLRRQHDGQPHTPQENVKQNPFDGLLGIVVLVWFIIGCFWVYGVEATFDDATAATYCDQLTYVFAFIVITATLVLCACAACLVCCCGCCAICFLRRSRQDDQP